ncbi:MAG: CHAD domain-containing protein [Planctomycetes bacterium]|nr:CHAD domain-containing protein [Planctomycetota bacterium]MBI3834353.1 CHAD domain-containing protein [Planctomycetota bacterium]
MSKSAQKFSGDTPGGAAAKLVIGERMRVARKHLRRVCSKKRTCEDIHQLRVATRRLGVALSMFKFALRKNPRRAVEKANGKLRRACGDLRDCDVLSEILKSHFKDGAADSIAMDSIGKALCKSRAKADQSFNEEIVEFRSRFEDATKELTGDLRQKKFKDEDAARGPFKVLADRAVRRRLHEFRSAASAELEHLDQMHALRIAAKHLRYAMEAAETCYPPQFGGELYHGVESVQSRLGHINDLRNLIAIGARVAAKNQKRKSKGSKESRSLRELLETWTAALGEAQRTFLEAFLSGERDALDSSFRALLDGILPHCELRAVPEKVAPPSRSIELSVGAPPQEPADVCVPQVNNL